MNNYEKINTYLKHGLCVSVKDRDGEYQIISTMKDEDGDYKAGSLYSTLEEAKQNIREGHCYSNEELEEFHKDWTDITPFHLDFEPYPIGMKVKVIKTGTFDEIEFVYPSGYVIKNSTQLQSHTELMPNFEKEEEKVIEMTLTQIEEKLNIKGLKIIK